MEEALRVAVGVVAAALLVATARALAGACRAARAAATLPCDHVLLLGGCVACKLVCTRKTRRR
jgi:hypothetical protein